MQTVTENPNNEAIPAHLQRKIRSGKSIQDLAKELVRIEETKQDFNVPVSALTANVVEAFSPNLEIVEPQKQVALSFKNGDQHDFTLNTWSSGQVAAFTDIPREYFRRLNDESPDLLAKNINHGLAKAKENTPRLVRTIDGHVRGFLSRGYRMLDSHDLMEAIMPMLIDFNFEVVSCELTEKRLYLKTATPKIQGEVKVGDVVSYGVMVSTSDVGAGSLRVEPFFMRLWCLNGQVGTSNFRRAHLGRSNQEREVQEILTDETKRLSDRAFFATVKDYMTHTMRPEIFKAELVKMQDAALRPIKNLDLETVVEVTMKTVGITGEGVKRGILESLADGNQNAGLTQWGLVNSFTAAAKMTSIDYDTATDLERAGGQILNLTNSQWKRISEVTH